MRKDIEFQTRGDNVTLRGWMYVPDGVKEPAACVVLAHGFTAVKEMALDKYCEVFSEAGLVAIAYDHRNFGASDGEPRGEADPSIQRSDYRDAISFARNQPEVDPERIGIWGTSYSAGTVVEVGSIDRRVRAVCAQVPVISGYWNVRRLMQEQEWDTFQDQIREAREREWNGEGIQRLKVVSADPEEAAAVPGERTRNFFFSYGDAAPNWVNETTWRTLEYYLEFEPEPYFRRVSPAALQMIVSTEDTTTPTDLALKAFNEAHEPKELFLINGHHYESYIEQFDVTAAAARDFFLKYL